MRKREFYIMKRKKQCFCTVIHSLKKEYALMLVITGTLFNCPAHTYKKKKHMNVLYIWRCFGNIMYFQINTTFPVCENITIVKYTKPSIKTLCQKFICMLFIYGQSFKNKRCRNSSEMPMLSPIIEIL